MTMRALYSRTLACLIVFALIAGCAAPTAPAEPPVMIGVIGPMESIHGRHHWYGATLATEEINEAGGVQVGQTTRQIELVKVDSNELESVAHARAAMERAITEQQVDFVVGGYEIMAALEMQDVIADHETVWLGCGVVVSEMCRRVGMDYDRYKYWFRAGPVNSFNVGMTTIETLKMVANAVRDELNVDVPRVAIVAEDAPWVTDFGLLSFYQAFIPQADMEIVDIWRPAPDATDLTDMFSAIVDRGAHIILFNSLGPLGVHYARQWAELQVPAASTGIHMAAIQSDFPEATGGNADYITYWHSIARVEMTERTIPFFDTFVERYDEYPFFTAVTYDGIYLLKEAMESAGTLDAESIIAELEEIDYDGAFGRIVFTPRGYMQMDDEIPHDLTWGPGYATSLGMQWQDGEPRCVWPREWEGTTYEGTVEYQLPPWVVDYWEDAD